MAVAAAIMALRPEMTGREKWLWTMTLFAFAWIEIRAINHDRDENDTKQRAFIEDQRRHFGDIAKEIGTAIAKSEAQFNETLASVGENVKTVTGGDSVCYLMISPNQGILFAMQRGRYPLHDVSVRMSDLDKANGLLATRPLTMDNVFAADTNFQIGDMPVNGSKILDTHYKLTGNKYSFNIFFSGLNGFWTEELRLRLVNGEWTQAARVTRTVTAKNGRVYEKFVFQKIDRNFPRSSDGKAQWY
jgi:hypothetical protein